MIYLIHCKNLYKYSNVPPSSTTLIKEKKKQKFVLGSLVSVWYSVLSSSDLAVDSFEFSVGLLHTSNGYSKSTLLVMLWQYNNLSGPLLNIRYICQLKIIIAIYCFFQIKWYHGVYAMTEFEILKISAYFGGRHIMTSKKAHSFHDVLFLRFEKTFPRHSTFLISIF
jgi:hypothetical protein